MTEVSYARLSTKHWAIAFISILVLGCVAAFFWASFLADDTMITLRYSQRLIEGKGLTWNDGEYVEGYSNLLWVLITAGCGWIGFDMLITARLLCFGLTALTIFCVIVYFARNHPKNILAPAAASLLLATSLPMALWSVAGLEQPLVAALLMLAIVCSPALFAAPRLSPRIAIIPALALSAICLTRPDGPLFTVAFCLALLWQRGLNKASLRDACLLAMIPLAVYFGQVAWRLYYYGELVPNTAFVKVPASLSRVKTGLGYVLKGMLYSLPLILPALWIVFREPRTAITRLVLCISTLWCVYLIFVGGDGFTVFRHFVPILAPISILAGIAIGKFNWKPKQALGLGIPMLAGGLALQTLQPIEEWHVDDAMVIGRLLKRGFYEKQALIAVNTAGAIPYYSGLPSIDMLGLNDAHIAQQKVSQLGQGWLGHDHGDASYVLRRAPDIIVMGSVGGDHHSAFPSDVGLLEHPSFHHRYHLITLEGDDPHTFRSRVWIRKEGGQLGMQQDAGHVFIPGYQFATSKDVIARVYRSGQVGTVIEAGVHVMSPRLTLEAGNWAMSIKASEAGIQTVLRDATSRKIVKSSNGYFQLTLPAELIVEIFHANSSSEAVYLFEVELTRA